MDLRAWACATPPFRTLRRIFVSWFKNFLTEFSDVEMLFQILARAAFSNNFLENSQNILEINLSLDWDKGKIEVFLQISMKNLNLP